jgi:hypothetical protein
VHAAKVKDDRPTLTLTGGRRNRLLLVRVHDKPLWVSYGHFYRLVRLIIARGRTQGGFVADPDVLYPEAVCRLRRAIDEAVGPGAGNGLIETGLGCEYRLSLSVTHVTLSSDFPEISDLGVITPDEMVKLQKLCQPCNRDVMGK